jgi:phospholipid/cholesterol/gamma-HCH transport system substrate-binding protein
MLGKHLVETIMGAFVLVVAAIFLGFAYVSADLTPSGGYGLVADFSSVDGLTAGSDVRIGGVKVGVVTDQSVDLKDYRAIVHMNLQPYVHLPDDSKAVIASAGLLGGKYVKIEAGHSKTMLKAGDEIKKTEGSVVLEELLGKIIFLATGDQGSSQNQGQGQGAAPDQGDNKTPDQGQGTGGAAAPAK